MFHNVEVSLLLGSIGLGLVHGIEPGHGWPIAASYALDQSNEWLYGFASSLILGVGHLVSSVAMVVAFFWAKSYFGLGRIGWMNYVAGALLVALGVHEYVRGRSHSHGDDHGDEDGQHRHDRGGGTEEHGQDHHDHRDGHGRDDHDRSGHGHGGGGDRDGPLARLKSALPFVGGHSHHHGSPDETADRSLWGIAGFAFVLGFAHEEEFEIIAICTGSNHCLELMLAYALAVIVGIVGLTLLLIAGYYRYEDRVERYAEQFPALSAAILILMGVGFLVGVF